MRIRGFVLCQDTGSPLRGVRVAAVSESGTVGVLTTDDAGYFSFDIPGASASSAAIKVQLLDRPEVMSPARTVDDGAAALPATALVLRTDARAATNARPGFDSGAIQGTGSGARQPGDADAVDSDQPAHAWRLRRGSTRQLQRVRNQRREPAVG
jgi:hypothetical protein